MNWAATVCIFFLWVSISACSLLPPTKISPVAGRVLDQDTGQPVAGAIVVVRWIGTATKAFVDQHTACYHVETAKTDAEGRYATTSWLEASKYRDLGSKEQRIKVYKASYRQVDSEAAKHYLVKDNRGTEDRLQYILYSVISCGGRPTPFGSLVELYKAQHEEVAALPESYEQKKLEFWLQSLIDEREMGLDKARRLYQDRLKALYRRYL